MTISNANEMKGYVVNEGHMEIKNEVRKKKQKQLCERSGNRSHSRNRNRNRHSSRSHSRQIKKIQDDKIVVNVLRINILVDGDGYDSVYPPLLIIRFFASLPWCFALDQLLDICVKKTFPIYDLIVLATSFDYHSIYFIAIQMRILTRHLNILAY